MSDYRSNKCVLIAHCILAQTVRAEGCAKSPSAIRAVVTFCLDNDINIIQMPCPETLFSGGGLGREPHGKKWYEQAGLRDFCCILAEGQATYAKQLTDGGKEILGIIGVEHSPACSTIENSKSPYRQYGIYIEELESALTKQGLTIPTISINPEWHKKLAKDLHGLLSLFSARPAAKK